MKFTINGQTFNQDEIRQPSDDNQLSVASALSHYFQDNPKPSVFAVAKNQTFVSQRQYETTQLNDGDNIDVFSPIQGG